MNKVNTGALVLKIFHDGSNAIVAVNLLLSTLLSKKSGLLFVKPTLQETSTSGDVHDAVKYLDAFSFTD